MSPSEIEIFLRQSVAAVVRAHAGMSHFEGQAGELAVEALNGYRRNLDGLLTCTSVKGFEHHIDCIVRLPGPHSCLLDANPNCLRDVLTVAGRALSAAVLASEAALQA